MTTKPKKITINTTQSGLSVHIDTKKIDEVQSFSLQSDEKGQSTLTLVTLAKNEQGSNYMTGGGDDRSLATERLVFTGTITLKGEGDEPEEDAS